MHTDHWQSGQSGDWWGRMNRGQEEDSYLRAVSVDNSLEGSAKREEEK